MTYPIEDGIEMPEADKGGNPGRTDEQNDAIKKAASNVESGLPPFTAAEQIYAGYYSNSNVTDEQRRRRIRYLAECISDYRRGTLVIP